MDFGPFALIGKLLRNRRACFVVAMRPLKYDIEHQVGREPVKVGWTLPQVSRPPGRGFASVAGFQLRRHRRSGATDGSNCQELPRVHRGRQRPPRRRPVRLGRVTHVEDYPGRRNPDLDQVLGCPQLAIALFFAPYHDHRGPKDHYDRGPDDHGCSHHFYDGRDVADNFDGCCPHDRDRRPHYHHDCGPDHYDHGGHQPNTNSWSTRR